MTVSKIAPQALIRLTTAETARHPIPSLRTRIIARIFAARLDQAVEDCDAVRPGSTLAVHVTRLTSVAEREQLAAGLRSAMRAAQGRPAAVSACVAVHRNRINAVTDLIDTALTRLDGPLPVRARGVARMRLLLADGGGPLYATGSGSLSAALRGALAAL